MDISTFYQTHEATIDHHYDTLKTIIDTSGEKPEGNCLYFHYTTRVFPELICKRANILFYARGAKKIAEIGVNAGHSALLLHIAADPLCTVLLFDLNAYKYTEPAIEYLRSQFSQHVTTVFGDSRKTFPEWLAAHADEKGTYDLVHVDGGHELSCFTSDITHALRLVKIGGTIIVDDTQIDYIWDWVKINTKAGIIEIAQHQLPTVGYSHLIVKRLK
jgi:hypothetical protein